jgi:uncharacterized membrane protein
MNKVLVAVFNSEKAAFEGLSALKNLHKDGDITLYASAVLTKDAASRVTTKQAVDEGPAGTALGLFTGSLIGLLGGPVGLAVGASLGTLTGLMIDLDKAGVDLQFVDEVSKTLVAGKSAVLADVEEGWTMPVDTRLGELGGMVFRRLREELVEDQMAREAAAFRAEAEQLDAELAQAHAEHKAALQKQLDAAKQKLRMVQDQAKARIEQTRAQAQARITALQTQVRQAGERRKARLERRIATLKSELEARLAKLREAARLTKEAVTV